MLTVDLEVKNDKVSRVRVDMGEPILKSADIPTTLPGDPPVNAPLDRRRRRRSRSTCVSMGNPHAVMYVGDEFFQTGDRDLVAELGPKIEHAPAFPRRVNAHFVKVHSPDEVTMRTWERGSGITLACGTGACAVCVAGVLTGRTGRKLLAHLPGGDLELEWSEADNHVYMTGPATEVFTGEWPELSRDRGGQGRHEDPQPPPDRGRPAGSAPGSRRRLVRTLRFEYRCLGPVVRRRPASRPDRGIIYSIWHENLLVPGGQVRPPGPRRAHQQARRRPAPRLAHHGDGDGHGARVDQPRRDRGGPAARPAGHAVRRHLAVTPDGPRGPRRVVQPGMVYVASRTGMQIVPSGSGTTGRGGSESWDRFAVPKPFTRAR